MKHFLMAALLMTGVATFAQTELTTEKSEVTRPKREKVTPESQTKQLTEELGLNKKQQAKVTALFEEEAKAKAELKEQRKLAVDAAAKDELKVKAKEEKAAFKEKMKNILTKEQFEKWTASKTKQPVTLGEKEPVRLKSKSVAPVSEN